MTQPASSIVTRVAARLAVVGAAAIALVLIIATAALAHVDLESSTPSDGTSVTAVPSVIELRFTTEAVPAGEGIVLATADGTPVAASVTQPEPTVVRVVPAEPLVNGVYGVLWSMRAGDAHPRTGTITFRIDAPLPSAGDDGAAQEGQAGPAGDEPEVVALDPVFDVPGDAPATADWLARLGRWAAMTGALVGIGAFAFAATSLIGTKREVEEAGYWVRRAGVIVIAGSVIELIGASMVMAGSVGGGLLPTAIVDTVSGSFGIALFFRVLGGAAMLQGTAIIASESTTPIADATRIPSPTRRGADTVVIDPVEPAYRLDVHHERLALAGIALVTASYLFDGHTVTATPTFLVRAASATHVLAGGVWVGGVVLMAWTLARRHRRGADLGAAPMVLRFSRVASVALVAVAVAGTALAISILDAPSEMLTTPWGRVLIVKLLAVGAAAAIGAYNHLVTVPALEADADDGAAADRLRRLVRIEGLVLLMVVAVTAVLVGVAS